MMRTVFISFYILLTTQLFSINIDVQSVVFSGRKTFAEVYCRVDGNSVKWNDSGNQKQASVEFVLIISRQGGGIEAYDKFVLNSPVKDSMVDFLVVKRFALSAGEYKVKVEAIDKNDAVNKIELEQRLTVGEYNAKTSLSDVLLLGVIRKDSTDNNLVKNGVYMEPLPYQHADRDENQLSFYAEVYRPDSSLSAEYFIQYSIMKGFKDKNATSPVLVKYKKLNNQAIEPLLVTLPLNTLLSGDYHLLVNVVDKLKLVICSRKVDFTRSNPEADMAYLESYNDNLENSFVQNISADEMDYVLKAHLPITEQHQVSTLGELLRSNRIKSQRQFIFQLWKSKFPSNPGEAYSKYMEVARAVDKKFYSNVGYGFQSDRGHIFLKYGKPTNVISVDNEVDAPPYEIWYYTNMPTTRQTNVRFIFYNPSLAHNDYKLLHSTCLSERSNAAWEVELYKSVPMERQGNSTDATKVGDNWNRNARKLFNEF